MQFLHILFNQPVNEMGCFDVGYEPVVGDATKKANVETFLADLPADLKAQARAWLKERGFDQIIVRTKAGGA